MNYTPSRKDDNSPFYKEDVLKVWMKAHPLFPLSNYTPPVATDICGRKMLFEEYGNRDSEFGWEIDHVRPREKGGKSNIENLQPLNWRTNAEKSDTYPWSCPPK